MLEISHLYCGYGGGDVVKDVCLRAEAGEILCVAGPNGCGKSTLLKAAAHIIGYQGSVTLDGEEAALLPRKRLARKIAFMEQASRVYFPYRVYDAVALGRYAHARGFMRNLSPVDKDAVEGALRALGLEDERDALTHELSGGQLQRVFLARTLAQDPGVILLDEPTNHLDLKHQLGLLRHLSGWAKGRRKAVVAVFHDLNLAHAFADKVALMSGGRVAAYGTPTEALSGDLLQAAYGVDVRGFMLESLDKWRSADPNDRVS
jgi:iron complex transport system ATP-binding protein